MAAPPGEDQVDTTVDAAVWAQIRHLAEPPPDALDLPPVDDEPGLLHQQLVRDQLRRMRAQADARAILAVERRGPVPPFDLGTLGEVLARPPQPASRVDQLVPWAASTLITAQRKVGKTTLTLNLARSLLTGQDFLGRFGVRPVDGMVALLNFEVSAATLAGWADDMRVPADRLLLVNLRGHRNPLGDDDDRGRLAGALRARGVETVIVDPFGRAYTGASQNDAGEVGAFLSDLDRFARAEVSATDLVLTTHAGWNGERTRGSSALEDWADAVVTVTRDESEEGDGQRYLRAFGRDVEVDEDRLVYDHDSRTLTLAGSGSRSANRASRRVDQLRAAVVEIVAGSPGINGTEVERQLRESGVSFQKGQERKVLADLVASAELVRSDGARGAKCYSIGSPSPTLPDVPHGDAGDPPHPPPIGGVGPEGRSDPSPSPELGTDGTAGTARTASESVVPAVPQAVSAGQRLCPVCHQPITTRGEITHPTCEAA